MADTLDYVALRPCRCLVLWLAGGTDHTTPAAVARFAGRAVRRGYDVRRMTTAEVKSMPWACIACERKPRERKATPEPKGGGTC